MGKQTAYNESLYYESFEDRITPVDKIKRKGAHGIGCRSKKELQEWAKEHPLKF